MMTDVRPFSPTPSDLALVNRLAKSQFLMDSTTALTRGVNPLEAALLAAVPLADLGQPTLILREKDEGYLGQIRHRMGEEHAYLSCLAPVPRSLEYETQWLRLIEGLVVTAGRRGAIALRAEVPEDEAIVFHLLRRAGFAVYARQVVYRHQPATKLGSDPLERFSLRPMTDRDVNRILALQVNLIPGIVQQAVPYMDPNHLHGLVVESRDDGHLVGYLNVIEGKSGYLVAPFIHPDVFEAEATQIFACALQALSRSDKIPVYLTVLSIQEWLRTPLQRLGLEESQRHAIFVKHVATRVRKTEEFIQAAKEAIFSSVVTAIEVRADHEQTPWAPPV